MTSIWTQRAPWYSIESPPSTHKRAGRGGRRTPDFITAEELISHKKVLNVVSNQLNWSSVSMRTVLEPYRVLRRLCYGGQSDNYRLDAFCCVLSKRMREERCVPQNQAVLE